mgnify:CR=1 FL=1
MCLCYSSERRLLLTPVVHVLTGQNLAEWSFAGSLTVSLCCWTLFTLRTLHDVYLVHEPITLILLKQKFVYLQKINTISIYKISYSPSLGLESYSSSFHCWFILWRSIKNDTFNLFYNFFKNLNISSIWVVFIHNFMYTCVNQKNPEPCQEHDGFMYYY